MMLSVLNAFQENGEEFPRKAHMLYTGMLWEASEKVIIHFLDQVPNDYQLDQGMIIRLFQLVKYSNGLWKMLLGHSALIYLYWKTMIQEFRLDLVEDPRLFSG